MRAAQRVERIRQREARRLVARRSCVHGQRFACRECAARVETVGIAAAHIEQARTLLRPYRNGPSRLARKLLRAALHALGAPPA